MLTHRSIATNLAQLEPVMPTGPGDRILAVLPFFHIYGLTALMNAPLRLRRHRRRPAPLRPGDLPRGDRRSTASPACTWPRRSSSPSPSTRPSSSYDLSSLRYILSAAAPLDAGPRRRLLRPPRPAARRPGVRHDRTLARHPRRAPRPGRDGAPRHRRQAHRRHRDADRLPRRPRQGRRRRRTGRDRHPRPPGHEGLPRPPRGHRRHDRRRRLAAHRRHRPRRRRRLAVRRRPGQGTHQVQGLPGRPRRTRSPAAHPPRHRRRRRHRRTTTTTATRSRTPTSSASRRRATSPRARS